MGGTGELFHGVDRLIPSMVEGSTMVASMPSTPVAQTAGPDDVVRPNDSAKRRPLACANYTELLDSIQRKKKRRRSIEALLDLSEPHRVSIPRGETGSYGFNLRGSLLVRGHTKQRGQYIRSVDFNGPAHVWGLRAGDRVLAVNSVICEEEDHEYVISLIRSTPKNKNLELVVVSDPNMKGTAQTATSGLLKTKAKEVINEATGIPHFTVEMTEAPLGRTKMLQRKIFGSPMVKAKNGKDEHEILGDTEKLTPAEVKALEPSLSGDERDTPSPDLTAQASGESPPESGRSSGTLWV